MYEIPQGSLDRLNALISNAKDDAITALWAQCADEFMAICGRDDIPQGSHFVIERMIAYRYSQINAEGLSGQSASGMSESYLSDYPGDLKRAIYRYRRMRWR